MFKYLKRGAVCKLPKSTGVYCFKSRKDFLYIGKAANIKERVKNHLERPSYRDGLFINQIEKIGYIKTSSEFAEPSAHLTSHPASQGSTIEALILEANLIKKHQPKYNVVWRDDKNYFYVGISKETFPRIFITHRPITESRIWNKEYRRKNSKFKIVGPFVDGEALKKTLKILRKVFPYRTCRTLPKHPCLWYQLERCPAPCLLKSQTFQQVPTGKIQMKKDYQRNVKNIFKLLQGKKTQLLRDLKREMKKASKEKRFETAEKIRDQIQSLEKVISHTRVFEPGKNGLQSEWKKTQMMLKKILKTKGDISRIEAYDVSNIQGKEATGSLITFIQGIPEKNFYRRFKIRIAGKPDDVAMIKEILKRRLKHKEWSYPDLILIDGGKGQLNIAKTTVKNKIPVIALAKKRSVTKPRTKLRFGAGENKLYIENRKKPILIKNLPREIFNLILQLRDEAHRFAIAYHRKLRRKQLLKK